MKRFFIVCAFMAVCLSANPIFAQQWKDDNNSSDSSAPAGMEYRKVNGDVTVLVPKGSRMSKPNAATNILEGPEEYTARKLVEVDARLQSLEAAVKELTVEISALKSGSGNQVALPPAPDAS